MNEDRDGQPIDGVLTYSFRAIPPREPTRVSTVQSREMTFTVLTVSGALLMQGTEFATRIEDVAAGMYFYHLKVDATGDEKMGKFAIIK